MKQKSGLIGVVYAAILSAIAGYFFRATQLSGSSSVPLIAFSILMVFVFALAAASLEKKSAYEDIYRPCGQDLVFSLLGALGLLAGCALGFRGSIAQMLVSLLGLLAGLICLWGVNGLKRMLKADDALDVFGVHGVGGLLGAILTGVFAAPSLGGTGIYDYVANKVAPDYSIAGQVWIQFQGVLTTLVWSGVVAFIAFKIADIVLGLRVPEDEEREGLDITSHGESAYHN